MNYFSYLRFLIFVIFLWVGATDVQGQCCTNCPVELPDVQHTTGYINMTVGGAVNNDLSHANQGVCGVTVSFKHDYLGDLRIKLVSPAGQSVTLIGPIGLFEFTDSSFWEVSFVPCGSTPQPDPGHLPKFNNNNQWGISGHFTGSYYPNNGCLEDFNTGPVNGEWTLEWEDGQPDDVGEFFDYSIVFCDNTGVDCSTCSAEGGTIGGTDSIKVCYGSPILANIDVTPFFTNGELPPSPADEYGYTYVVVDDGQIVDVNTEPDLSGYAGGTYQICGLSYALEDSLVLPQIGDDYDALVDSVMSVTASYCADMSNNCITVVIFPPTSEITIDSLICPGESVLWGGVVYSSPGLYKKTINDPVTGCAQDVYLNLQVNTDLTKPFFTQVGPICVNDNPVTLPDTSLNGIKGAWDVNPIVPNTVGESWHLFTPDAGQCADTTSMVVRVAAPPNLTASALGAITCKDPSIQLVGQSDDPHTNDYDWVAPNGAHLQGGTVWVDQPGDYILVGDNTAFSCPGSTSVTVDIDTTQPLVFFSVGEISCLEPFAEIIPDAVGQNYDFVWTFPDQSSSIESKLSGLSEGGDYQAQVTGWNGCVSDYTLTVPVDTLKPDLQASVGNPIDCNHSTTQLLAASTTSNVAFDWSGPNNLKSNLSEITVSTSGDYELKIIGGNGCFRDTVLTVLLDTATVSLNPLALDTIDCNHATVALAASVPANVEATWYGLDGLPMGAGANVNVSSPGVYKIEGKNTTNGCIREEWIPVTADLEVPIITLEIDGVIDCYDDIVPVSLHSNRPFTQVEWMGNQLYVQDSTDITIREPGDYEVSLIGDNGCEGKQTFEIGLDTTAPVVVAESRFLVTCNNNRGWLDVTAGSSNPSNTYQWISLGNGTVIDAGDSISTFVEGLGLYQLTVFNLENGCSYIDSVEVEKDSNVPKNLVTDIIDVQCYDYANGAIVIKNILGGTGPYVYRIGNGPFGQNSIFKGLEGGEYILSIEDANGCTLADTVRIDEPEPMYLDLGPDLQIKLGDEVNVVASFDAQDRVDSIYWNMVLDSTCVGDPNCYSQHFEPASSLELIATLVDTAGCEVSDQMEVFVDDAPNVYVPTVFSPNGDGYNDELVVYSGQGVAKILDFMVADRWGNQLFYQRELASGQGWNGISRGQYVASGVYVYQFKVVLSNGVVVPFVGDFTLVR